MPRMNGPDACVEIRKLGFKFPIYGVTGDAEVELFIRAGADGASLPPPDPDDSSSAPSLMVYLSTISVLGPWSGVMLKPVKSDELLGRLKTGILKALQQAKADAVTTAASTSSQHLPDTGKHDNAAGFRAYEKQLKDWFAASDAKVGVFTCVGSALLGGEATSNSS